MSLWSTCQTRGLWRSHDEWDICLGVSDSPVGPVVICPGPEFILGIHILNNWQNPQI